MAPPGRRALSLLLCGIAVALVVAAVRRQVLVANEARRPYVAGEGTVPDDGAATDEAAAT